MEKAAQEEKQRKAESRKRPPSAVPQDGPDPKRAKLEDVNASNSAAFLAAFDFTKLPTALVADLIVANIQAFSVEELTELVRAYREGKTSHQPGTAPLPVPPIATTSSVAEASAAAAAATNGKLYAPGAEGGAFASLTPEPIVVRSKSPATPTTPPPIKEEEPVDPLQMDIDEEELEFEPDKLNMKVDLVVRF